jgi:hypothetical protein
MDSDGGLAKARTDYAAQREASLSQEEALKLHHAAQIRRINQAGKAFVTAVREESLDLFMSDDVYLVENGSIYVEEGMSSPWRMVVDLEGQVLVLRDGHTSGDVISHYQEIYRPSFSVDTKVQMAQTHKLADRVIERLAMVLEGRSPMDP